jgi:hypothetical protein
MPKDNGPSIQRELDDKLHELQSLVGDCIDLAAQLQSSARKTAKSAGRTQHRATSVDFSLNQRAFLKRYATNLSSGPKKFVAVVACLAKGETSKDVPLNEIEQLWNKSSSKTLLGMKFNRFFSTTARENGWVDSKKRGFYRLESSWKDIFADD